MVGTDHQAGTGTGDGVLGHHAHARLGVADDEVHQGRLAAFQRLHFRRQGTHRRSDVHRVQFVRLDEVDARLGVMFVVLHVVRQAHGDEAVGLVAGLLTQFVDRALGEQGGGQRIDAAADAQDQDFQPGILQALLDEGDAPGDFGIERGAVGERRLDLELLRDLSLDGLHGLLLAGNLENVTQGDAEQAAVLADPAVEGGDLAVDQPRAELLVGHDPFMGHGTQRLDIQFPCQVHIAGADEARRELPVELAQQLLAGLVQLHLWMKVAVAHLADDRQQRHFEQDHVQPRTPYAQVELVVLDAHLQVTQVEAEQAQKTQEVRLHEADLLEEAQLRVADAQLGKALDLNADLPQIGAQVLAIAAAKLPLDVDVGVVVQHRLHHRQLVEVGVQQALHNAVGESAFAHIRLQFRRVPSRRLILPVYRVAVARPHGSFGSRLPIAAIFPARSSLLWCLL
ncbi:hypothetical protein L1887_53786 [Cichorium endivia]|nr:hypothetical protein L1887_53786 [Cichorium endivia]